MLTPRILPPRARIPRDLLPRHIIIEIAHMPPAQRRPIDPRRKARSRRGVHIPDILDDGGDLAVEPDLREGAVGRQALDVEPAVVFRDDAHALVGARSRADDVALLERRAAGDVGCEGAVGIEVREVVV